MNNESERNSSLAALVFAGGLLACAGLVWLILLSRGEGSTRSAEADREAALAPVFALTPAVDPTVATPTVVLPAAQATSAATAQDEVPAESPPVPRRLIERLLLEFDLDTGSNEFSGVALNEDADRLLIADDEGELFEFDLAADGQPVLPARRVLQVRVGGGDIEGIAWISGTTYVLAHENDGQITVVDFDDGVATIDAEHLVRTIDTGIQEIDGNGLEGVAYVGSNPGPIEFVAVNERPPTLVFINRDGGIERSVAVELGVPDVSDVWASPDGTYSVLSDEGRVLLDVRFDAAGAPIVTRTLDLVFAEGRFEQPEGVVRSRDGTQLYVVGEQPGPGRFVFGWWHSE